MSRLRLARLSVESRQRKAQAAGDHVRALELNQTNSCSSTRTLHERVIALADNPTAWYRHHLGACPMHSHGRDVWCAYAHHIEAAADAGRGDPEHAARMAAQGSPHVRSGAHLSLSTPTDAEGRLRWLKAAAAPVARDRSLDTGYGIDL